MTGSIFPVVYGNGQEFVQGPGYVMILQEMVHEARVIPLDGRPHAGPGVRSYMGDPRGHWEGDTLVVDTTNYSPKSDFRGSHQNLHVVERFTRVSPNRIDYEITVNDPTTWTKPWTAMIPLKLTHEEVYEYACHEGNLGMPNVLSGAREAEARAAAKAQGK